MVYFVQYGSNGPIKMGYAIEPWRRVKQLQTASHEELVLLRSIPGSRKRESEIKKHLIVHRKRGEWYEPASEVLGFIKSLDEAEYEVIDNRAYAVLRRDRDDERTDACPFCSVKHNHGSGDGHRAAHCTTSGTVQEVKSGAVTLSQQDGYIIRTRWKNP